MKIQTSVLLVLIQIVRNVLQIKMGIVINVEKEHTKKKELEENVKLYANKTNSLINILKAVYLNVLIEKIAENVRG